MCDDNYGKFNFTSCQYLYIMLILYYINQIILKNKIRRVEKRKEGKKNKIENFSFESSIPKDDK